MDTRHAQEQRHPDGFFVPEGLRLPPVPAEQEAIVGREDECRAGQLPDGAEGPPDPADEVVHRAQRRDALVVEGRDRRLVQKREGLHPGRLVAHVGLVEGGRLGQGQGRRPPMARGRADPLDPAEPLPVRGQGSDVEEERPGVGPGAAGEDEALGQGGQDVGLIVLHRPVSVVDHVPVVAQVVVVHAVGGRTDERLPVVPSARNQRPVDVAVQVLAHLARAVSGRLQPEGEVVVAEGAHEPGEAAARPAVAHHAVVVRVEAGEVGRARRAAQRLRDERLAELGAPREEPADVGQQPRLERGVEGDAVEVVRHHDDDVRPRAVRRGLRAAAGASSAPGRGRRGEHQRQGDRPRPLRHAIDGPRAGKLPSAGGAGKPRRVPD